MPWLTGAAIFVNFFRRRGGAEVSRFSVVAAESPRPARGAAATPPRNIRVAAAAPTRPAPTEDAPAVMAQYEWMDQGILAAWYVLAYVCYFASRGNKSLQQKIPSMASVATMGIWDET